MFPFQSLSLCLLYKSTLHGFSSAAFHSRCDNQGPTVSLILSDKNRTFGGYAQVSWESKNMSISGSGKSFVF
ncbi:MAG: TLD domain-containing protein [bacterium]